MKSSRHTNSFIRVHIAIFALFFLFAQVGWAQRPGGIPREPQSDQMQALRIAFFVEELELTPEESQSFWPLWNVIEAELKEHGDKIRETEDRIASSPNEEAIQQELEKLKVLQIQGIEKRHEAIERVSAVIGFQRAAQIQRIERDFRARIMRSRMQQGASDTPPPHKGPNQRGR